jgi:hypothetical protein
VDNFDARLVEEDEKLGVKDGGLDVEFDQGSQAIDGFSEVDGLGYRYTFRLLRRVASSRMGSWKNREHSIKHQLGAWNVGFMERLLPLRSDPENNQLERPSAPGLI